MTLINYTNFNDESDENLLIPMIYIVDSIVSHSGTLYGLTDHLLYQLIGSSILGVVGCCLQIPVGYTLI